MNKELIKRAISELDAVINLQDAVLNHHNALTSGASEKQLKKLEKAYFNAFEAYNKLLAARNAGRLSGIRLNFDPDGSPNLGFDYEEPGQKTASRKVASTLTQKAGAMNKELIKAAYKAGYKMAARASNGIAERDIFGAPISKGDWVDLQGLLSSDDKDEAKKIKEILDRPAFDKIYRAIVREYPRDAAVRAGFSKDSLKSVENEMNEYLGEVSSDKMRRKARIKKIIHMALVPQDYLGHSDRSPQTWLKNSIFADSLGHNISQFVMDNPDSDYLYRGGDSPLVTFMLPGNKGWFDWGYAKGSPDTAWMKPSRDYYQNKKLTKKAFKPGSQVETKW